MIPSRGLRWSSQSLGIGKRRLDPLSRRSLSSFTTPNGPSRSTLPFSKASALSCRRAVRPQILRASFTSHNTTPQRFQSTSTAAETASTTANTASAPYDTLLSNVDLSAGLDQIPVHYGYLKSLGLDYGWGPTSLMEWILEHIHVLAGTPWWGSIVLTAVAVRVALFYPYIGAADNAAKMATVNPITKPLYDKMRAASAAGDTAETMRVRTELQLIQKRAGISISKSLIPLIQAPLGFGTFFLLRAMAKLPVPGLETGGALWFTNLTLPDPYFILPAATAGVLHWVLRKGGETGVNTLSPAAVKGLSYGLPALTMAFTWWLPAGIQLSFLVSGILSAIQSRLFRWDPFRKWMKMTPMPKKNDPFAKAPTEIPSPYQPHIITAQKNPTTGVYEAPRSTSADKNTTILGGFQKEIKTTISGIQESAKQTMKSAREYTGQQRVDGKRTKVEIKQAEAYEKKRQEEERRKIEEMDLERRARREEKRRAKERRGR